ncbi:MAG: hypothetical protein J0L64_28180, partial [Acidobacteria bacterium]|nr:hypothetical protein [Acidobacteriota bacterium]
MYEPPPTPRTPRSASRAPHPRDNIHLDSTRPMPPSPIRAQAAAREASVRAKIPGSLARYH